LNRAWVIGDQEQKGDCETSSDVESDFALLGREVQGGRTDAGSAPTEAGG